MTIKQILFFNYFISNHTTDIMIYIVTYIQRLSLNENCTVCAIKQSWIVGMKS